MNHIKSFFAITAVLLLGTAVAAVAQDNVYTMTMKNGAFIPPSLNVPAHQKIHLVVKNEGPSASEFESYPLNQEQKIKVGESADMYFGPLDPGKYPVFDDNNPDTTGNVVAQ